MHCPNKGFTTFSLHKRGFTLIELLVVISIIAILSVVGFTSFTNVTKGARDAKRKVDIDAIAKAYEVKYKDDIGQYTPLDNTAFTSGTIPQDPNSTKGYYYNWLDNDKSGFRVCASLENNGNEACTTSAKYCYCKDSTQGKVKLSQAIGAYIDPSGTPNPIYANTTATHTGLGPGSINPAPSCDTGGTLRDGLVGYWKMDDDPSWDENNGIVLDSSYDGSNGRSVYGSNGSNGQSIRSANNNGDHIGFGKAGLFDGNSQVVMVETSGGAVPSNLRLRDAISISAWVRPNGQKSPKSYIVAKGWGSSYDLAIDTDNKILFQITHVEDPTDAKTLKSSNAVTTDGAAWSHVVGVYERAGIITGGALKIYINGALEGTSSVYGQTIDNKGKFAIGGLQHMACNGPSCPNYYYGNGLNGLIDDVRIYKRALSGGFPYSEISNLYNSGNGCIPQ